MIQLLAGPALLITTFLVILSEWGGEPVFSVAAGALVLVLIIAVTPSVGWSRRIFVFVAVVLTAAALAIRPDWGDIMRPALQTAGFIAAFFTALTCLREAAGSSQTIEKNGQFLAAQPPGRRYAALTVGGHLFGLLLNYGSLALLGALAEANARREPNAEIRNHRTRRMLLAIQRGFVSTLCWSPLAFASAISIALVPGALWGDTIGYCLVSGLLMGGLGWALDTIFKPKLSSPPPQREKPPGSWASLAPMLLLLAILAASVGGLHVITGVRAAGVVMPVVPLIALVWIALQNAADRPIHATGRRAAQYAAGLYRYRSDVVLLVMAGYIGTLGSGLISPWIAASGFDLRGLPGWLILVSLVWIVPLTGLLGMNPILSVSLIAPLLPPAADLGVTPAIIIAALTAGWALSGASSPYTATTLLIGSIGQVSAWRVGLKWNGLYTLICALALSAWITIIVLV